MTAIFNFVSKNWVPITAGVGGVIAGFFVKKTSIHTKTGNMFSRAYTSSWTWIKGLFGGNGKDTKTKKDK